MPPAAAAVAATGLTTNTPATLSHVIRTAVGAAHQATVTTTTPTTTTTVPPASSGAQANDRGVIHQIWVDLGGSKESAHTAQIYLAGPLKVVVILLVAFVLARLVSRLSFRMVNGLRLVSPLVQATPRGAARVQTLAGAFTSVFRALIWVVALLEILNVLSINLVPFVATATVIGAAVGFGAQSLVKDFLSGVLLLAEDQFGVGDHIAVGTGSTSTSGTVESVNLRVTRLRGLDGGVLYVPNGDIRILSNDTETDSQALVDVMVPYGTDLVAAGVAAQGAARRMAEDPEWAQEFVGTPYFAGVPDAIGANGLTLRVVVLTRPGQHMRLAREMRLRIVEELRRNHVAWLPADTAPAATPPMEELDRVRAEQRQAEQETAAHMRRPPARRGRAGAAAKRAVAKRIRARRRAAGNDPAQTDPAQTDPAETDTGDSRADIDPSAPSPQS
jgi:moderate conductance mechanosensitive channel